MCCSSFSKANGTVGVFSVSHSILSGTRTHSAQLMGDSRAGPS